MSYFPYQPFGLTLTMVFISFFFSVYVLTSFAILEFHYAIKACG